MRGYGNGRIRRGEATRVQPLLTIGALIVAGVVVVPANMRGQGMSMILNSDAIRGPAKRQ